MMARILVVDDSSMARRALRRILEQSGHQVIEAVDGMAALERYYLDRPDLVLLDMTMQGMHGMDVLSRLREMDAGVRIVVATADIQSSTRTMVAAEGGRGFITKPFEPAEVLQAVAAALEGDVS